MILYPRFDMGCLREALFGTVATVILEGEEGIKGAVEVDKDGDEDLDPLGDELRDLDSFNEVLDDGMILVVVEAVLQSHIFGDYSNIKMLFCGD